MLDLTMRGVTMRAASSRHRPEHRSEHRRDAREAGCVD
jgi:hypothetical protein